MTRDATRRQPDEPVDALSKEPRKRQRQTGLLEAFSAWNKPKPGPTNGQSASNHASLETSSLNPTLATDRHKEDIDDLSSGLERMQQPRGVPVIVIPDSPPVKKSGASVTPIAMRRRPKPNNSSRWPTAEEHGQSHVRAEPSAPMSLRLQARWSHAGNATPAAYVAPAPRHATALLQNTCTSSTLSINGFQPSKSAENSSAVVQPCNHDRVLARGPESLWTITKDNRAGLDEIWPEQYKPKCVADIRGPQNQASAKCLREWLKKSALNAEGKGKFGADADECGQHRSSFYRR